MTAQRASSRRDATTEPLRDGDRVQYHELARMAFGMRQRYDPEMPGLSGDRVRAVYDGDRLVASAGSIPFDQTFGGRPVACGGLTGVMVASDHRGYGLGRTVVAAMIQAMRGHGSVVSSLYPTTVSLYRSLGYEIGGWSEDSIVALADLPIASGELDWEPASLVDAHAAEMAASMALGHDGWVVPDELSWQRFAHLARTGEQDRDCWMARRDGVPVAMVEVRYTTSSIDVMDLAVDHLYATDHAALIDALGFVASHATTATTCRFRLPRHVWATVLDQPHRARVVQATPWMARLIDVPAALRARGWNPAVEASFDLEVSDDVIAENAGIWRVEVRGGVADVSIGSGSASMSMTSRGIAAWYAGAANLDMAVSRGDIVGADSLTLAALSAVVASSVPSTLTHHF